MGTTTTFTFTFQCKVDNFIIIKSNPKFVWCDFLCVLKFGGKSIGFGGKVQSAIVITYIKQSLKEDLL